MMTIPALQKLLARNPCTDLNVRIELGFMSRIPKSIRNVQVMQIETEEITYLVSEMARQHEESAPGEVDLVTAVVILAERYRDDQHRPFCIMERMRCLIELVTDERMRGWTVQGIEEGCLLTNEAIFGATAKCPLKADANRIWFDPDEFFQMALSETPVEGRA
jgi:hypothetical protein